MKTCTNSFLTRSIFLIFVFITISFNSRAQTPETSKFITVDQFGYLPDSKKVAVIRNPVIGYDSLETFQPGAIYTVVNTETGEQVFPKKGDATTQTDVSGGWYDASDYNKYTNWTANYVVDFMKAFLKNPGVWGDDYNIPESGNHIPDILDEAKWGIDYLLRLQRTNGSMLRLPAGNQETDDYGRFMAKMEAAAFLYEITGEQKYKTFFEGNYNDVHLVILTGDDGVWQTKFLKL